MAFTQRPLSTGLGFHTTADEVLQGVDLTGRAALVTGGYSGVGLEVTRALSRAGATVIVPARRPREAAAAPVGIERSEVEVVDLAPIL